MILKLMAEQKATATFWALSCAGCVQTGSGNATSLRALAREGGEASPVSSEDPVERTICLSIQFSGGL